MKKILTLGVILSFFFSSCKKECNNVTSPISLEMDISVTNKAGIAPGTDGYFNIFPVNGSTYAFTRNTNACNSLGIQMLKTSGSLCHAGNIPSLPTYVSAICGDGVNVYYFTDLQSSNKMQLYKRAASGTLSILAEIPYAMGNQPLISDMAYAAGKVYWTLKDPRTKLQSISTSPGSVVQTMLSLAPERYYGKIVICNGLICLVGSDRMAYPHLQIINLQDQKLWELPASDNRKMALIDNTDIYAILSNPQNSHMQEIGIYTAFGQYEKLYDVTGADISGATSIHMFKTSKGIVILVEGNQLPSLWNSITGERLQGRIFLLQGKKLIHLSDQSIFSDGSVYMSEDANGLWFANLFTTNATTSSSLSDVQYFMWK